MTNNNTINKKNKAKKSTNFIKQFRMDLWILKEDATDEDIIRYLNKYEGNKKEAYKYIYKNKN